MSATSPQAKRVLSRSWRVGISEGGRSEVRMICFEFPWSSLKVWKNSSCVASFPARNWISSMIRTSVFLYFSLNVLLCLFLRALISSLVNFSEVTIWMWESGVFSWI